MEPIESIFDPIYEPLPKGTAPLTEFHARDTIKVLSQRELEFTSTPDFYLLNGRLYCGLDEVALVYPNQIHVNLRTEDGKRFNLQMMEMNADKWKHVMNAYEIQKGFRKRLLQNNYSFMCDNILDAQEEFSGFLYEPKLYTAVQTVSGQTLDKLVRTFAD